MAHDCNKFHDRKTDRSHFAATIKGQSKIHLTHTMPSCLSARKWRERRTTASVRRAVGGAGRRHRVSGQRRDASCTRSVLGCRSRGEPTLVEPILEDTWSSLLIQIDLSCDHVRNAEQEEEEEESARDQEINNGVRSPTKALTLHHPLHTSPREYFNSVSIYEEHTCVCLKANSLLRAIITRCLVRSNSV